MQAYQLNDQDILFQHVAGSRLFKLNVETSDEDVRGVYAVPPEWRTFVNLTYNTKFNASEVSRDGQDDKLYELTHFMELVLKQNPTILETIHIDPTDTNVVIGTPHPVWCELYELYHVKPMVSQKLIGGLIGYASAQRQRLHNLFQTLGDQDSCESLKARKHAMHVMRLMYQARHLMDTGKFVVVLPEEQREHLLKVRAGEIYDFSAEANVLLDSVTQRYHNKDFSASLQREVSLIEVVELTRHVYRKLQKD